MSFRSQDPDPPRFSDETSSNTLTEINTSGTTKSAVYWRVVASHSLVTPEVLHHKYAGSGTAEDPYNVEFIARDPRDPMGFSMFKKWTITLLLAFATLALSFTSSVYSGGVVQIIEQFHCSEEVAALGISLFVLGFALGPLLWAPLSELYGRQILFFGTYGALTAFNAGCAGSKNITTLLVARFFAGALGSSPLTNAGGVIADMFPARQRGLALSIFAAAPFMGPTLGPIVGGFVGETIGWRWVMGVTAIFTGALWVLGTFTIPETYAPVLLRKRAAALSAMTGQAYRSGLEIAHGPPPTITQNFKIALSRPWILLFREPIVLLLSIYMAIIYGTLYMCFGAFPIVYAENRHWSQGISGLAFLGVTVGMFAAVIWTVPDNNRYLRAEDDAKARGERGAAPEARLPPCMIGAVCIPVGLFIFAWTNHPSIHWSVSVIFTAPFGFGMVLVFLSITNYLIDAYTIYAASVLAANSVLRSLFGAISPLFTTSMYGSLGIHWASTIPAFLALACVPFPFLFYKFGPKIRLSCKYSREAEENIQDLAVSSQPRRHNGRKSENKDEQRDLEKVNERGTVTEPEPELDQYTEQVVENERTSRSSERDAEKGGTV